MTNTVGIRSTAPAPVSPTATARPLRALRRPEPIPGSEFDLAGKVQFHQPGMINVIQHHHALAHLQAQHAGDLAGKRSRKPDLFIFKTFGR